MIGVAIQIASYFPLIVALLSMNTSGFTRAFTISQIEGMQWLSLDLYKLSFEHRYC